MQQSEINTALTTQQNIEALGYKITPRCFSAASVTPKHSQAISIYRHYTIKSATLLIITLSNQISNFITLKNRSVGLIGEHIFIRAGGLGFDFQVGQIGYSVANGLPPLRCFFGAV